jgi:hypothetical protein
VLLLNDLFEKIPFLGNGLKICLGHLAAGCSLIPFGGNSADRVLYSIEEVAIGLERSGVGGWGDYTDRARSAEDVGEVRASLVVVGNTRYRDTLETQGKYPLLERDVQSRGSVGRSFSIF